VTYVDRTLNCVDCGVEFIHSAADQEYYQQKGFVSDPSAARAAEPAGAPAATAATTSATSVARAATSAATTARTASTSR
jgi:hypothetical protein